jgi:hypothetical protein
MMAAPRASALSTNAAGKATIDASFVTVPEHHI